MAVMRSNSDLAVGEDTTWISGEEAFWLPRHLTSLK
jgi:hypothetical protein